MEEEKKCEIWISVSLEHATPMQRIVFEECILPEIIEVGTCGEIVLHEIEEVKKKVEVK